MKDRAFFSYSQGSICVNCRSKFDRRREEEERIMKAEAREEAERREKEFEDKIRKIVNKVLDERGVK